MLGRDLTDVAAAAGIETIPVDVPEIDITRQRTLADQLPTGDWLINCAAYTRVDDAQKEREAAYAVNAEGVRNLGEIAHARGVPILHLSTDYVFDGYVKEELTEQHRANPLSIYGASKLAGEKALRAVGGDFVIVRTQSLFGKHGANFVKAIVRKLKESDAPLRVVADQVSAPTYTRHLADALVRLVQTRPTGLFHITAGGSCSWYEYAQQIVAEIKPGHDVQPITAAELARPAKRLAHAVLSNAKFRLQTHHAMPTWREGLEAYFHEEDYFT